MNLINIYKDNSFSLANQSYAMRLLALNIYQTQEGCKSIQNTNTDESDNNISIIFQNLGDDLEQNLENILTNTGYTTTPALMMSLIELGKNHVEA